MSSDAIKAISACLAEERSGEGNRPNDDGEDDLLSDAIGQLRSEIFCGTIYVCVDVKTFARMTQRCSSRQRSFDSLTPESTGWLSAAGVPDSATGV